MDEAKRRELVEVLDEYDGVTYNTQEGQAFRNNAIEFWLRGKHILYQLDMAESEARASLHQKLSELGARRHQQPVSPPRQPVSPPTTPITPAASPSTPSIATALDPADPPEVEPPITNPASTPPVPPAEPAKPASVATPRSGPLGDILLHSDRIIAIELNDDLMVDKGNVLVIPLCRPDAPIPPAIPKDQFNLWKWFFQTATTSPPVATTPPPIAPQTPSTPAPSTASQPAARATVVEPEIVDPDLEDDEVEVVDEIDVVDEIPLPPTEPFVEEGTRRRGSAADIIEFLRSRKGAVRPKFIADQLGWTIKSVNNHLLRLKNEGIAHAPQTGFWTLTEKSYGATRPAAAAPAASPEPQPASPPPPPPPPRASAAEGDEVKRSRAGISPQVGRILAAMVYAAKTTGRIDLAAKHVSPYLSDRDAKQYGARMPAMIEKGLAERGLPLAETRGYHAKLTNKGIQAIREAGPWAWTYDGEEVPDWASVVFE